MWRPKRAGPDVVGDIHAMAATTAMTLTASQALAAEAFAGDAHLYLHGPPGRGKTRLVDWYAAVSEQSGRRVLRLHLHAFFAELHRAVDRCGGWRHGVHALIGDIDVLCLDEFAVHDPADGVFLDRIVRSIAASDVRMVVTSNRTPDEQMPNPLFHEGFGPTISLLKQIFTPVAVDGERDLRADGGTTGFRAGRWTVGEWASAEPEIIVRPASRPILLRRELRGGISIDFAELCDAPTSAVDYLWLAERYDCWTICGVYVPDRADVLARWASVLDVLHDADTRVEVWASCDRAAFSNALGGALPDAARTISRMSAWSVGPAS